MAHIWKKYLVKSFKDIDFNFLKRCTDKNVTPTLMLLCYGLKCNPGFILSNEQTKKIDDYFLSNFMTYLGILLDANI